jgi:hypothetical protein
MSQLRRKGNPPMPITLSVMALKDIKILGVYRKGVEGIMLRKGRDIGRCGGSGVMVVV